MSDELDSVTKSDSEVFVQEVTNTVVTIYYVQNYVWNLNRT